MQLALPATPKPGEGGSEVEWVRAVSYFLKLRSAVSVEGSDNEGLPAFIEEQDLTKHIGRVKCVRPSERRPGHGVNEMIASLHPGGRHAPRERAFATVSPWVVECTHLGRRTGRARHSVRAVPRESKPARFNLF